MLAVTDGLHYCFTDQNLAFRAVNQSIGKFRSSPTTHPRGSLLSDTGRAIRHANDWASIVLIDTRYTTPSAQKKLPEWLCQDIQNVSKSFAELSKALAVFCKARKGVPA